VSDFGRYGVMTVF